MAQQKIKVLFIDNSMAFGGALKSLSLLLHSDSFRCAVEPVVITAQDPEIIDAWLKGIPYFRYRRILDYRTKERLGILVGRLFPISWVAVLIRKCLALFEYFETIVSTLLIVCIARKRRVQVIHTNTGFFSESMYAAKILGLPWVVHCRGFFAFWDKSTKANLSKTSHVIAVSYAVANSIAKEGIPSSRITTIYDPVVVAAIDEASHLRGRIRSDLGIQPSHIAVAIFGRVVEWKGQKEFVNAMLLAMEKNRDILGVIVGDEADDTERSYFADIKRLIAASEHSKRFLLTGFRKDVEALYAGIDIFVHASIEPEPFGMVVAEAMAAGKAVIAANAGGPKEIISDGLEGRLVQPGDVGALSNAILELADSPSMRDMLGVNAKKKVRSFLDVETVARKTAELYSPWLGKQ